MVHNSVSGFPQSIKYYSLYSDQELSKQADFNAWRSGLTLNFQLLYLMRLVQQKINMCFQHPVLDLKLQLFIHVHMLRPGSAVWLQGLTFIITSFTLL